MGRTRKQYYSASVLAQKKLFFENLPEKQRRYYLASEYLQLGKGSQRYLSEVFSCARQVIINGVKELQSPDFKADYSRQRKKGAGRKKKKIP